ncbi:hypothetical protein BDY24DRAFT_393610 [Mrakia frigida]|uniref:uncharacterized protein n=1 Tax=Mrakia frigida TaxID=29902 RepID=UPI003FCC23CA
MAWWLEESCEGGSVSIAYLPQSPYAFVVLPRSSPLCRELNVPSSLRDACRPYKESLIGALILLPRPTLPMPTKISSLALDSSLDIWGITLPFINSLRQASSSVAVFAPSTITEHLPGIALLHDLLTSPADPNGTALLHQPTKVFAVPGPNADTMEVRRFVPEVVLVHNAKELWMLPNLVELRRRTGTRFYGFGTGKETFGESTTSEGERGQARQTDASRSPLSFFAVPEQKTTFFEFGIARKAQITLTPSVFLDDPALVKKDLINLLKHGALDYQLNLHPSTVVCVDALCNQDQVLFKNLTLSALMIGCRTSIVETAPFVVAGTEPLNPTHNPELLDRNVDLDTELAEATTFADLLKACKEYCAREGSLDAAGGVDLERAEADALGMIRSNLRNTSLINKYRRFIVAGPTKSTSEVVEGLKLGAENISFQDLLVELKGRYP